MINLESSSEPSGSHSRAVTASVTVGGLPATADLRRAYDPAVSGAEAAPILSASAGVTAPPVPSAVRGRERRGKRTFDVVVSAALLLLLSPILLVLAVVVKTTSQGAIFYPARRAGYGGGTFRCWKFRSMIDEADGQLTLLLASDAELRRQFETISKLEADPRITPVGRFMRQASLDELPQLWNVLVGDMSLVGPRPLPEPDWERYGADLTEVLSARPGITGLWQVSGRNAIPYDRRIALDLEYVRTASWGGDLGILLRTIPVVTWRRDGL